MMASRKKSEWLLFLILFLTPLLLLGCFDFMGCDDDDDDDDDIHVQTDPLVVQTQDGDIRGTENELARMYKGIPFAAPPVGDLRWKAPQDPAPWEGELDASQSADMCTQPGRRRTWHSVYDENGDLVVNGSEDCLYLDVYRPNNEDENLPVYVFFHGGSNVFGSAASFDGSNLAGGQNMIVVFAQYRLGALGWLSHPSLRQEPDIECSDEDEVCQAQELEIKKNNSGNYALLDNIKALEWVQNNIADFGGDPTRVTVGGQSAGAANIEKLLSTPLAKNLFGGAFLQSPGGDVVAVDEGDRRAALMLGRLEGFSEAEDIGDFLYSKPAADLVAAYNSLDVDGDGREDGTISGFADGTVLSGTHVEAIYDDEYNKVPIVIGSTQSEAGNFLPLLFADFPAYSTWAKAYDLFEPDFLPENTSWEDVFPDDANEKAYTAFKKAYSLGYKATAVDELARMLQQRQDDVYAYLFRWGEQGSADEQFATVFGAAHSMDLPLFFGADQSLFGYALTDENRQGFEALQDLMMAFLANFVKNGTPGTVADHKWLQWSNVAGESKCMVFDADFENVMTYMSFNEVLTRDLLEILAGDISGLDASAINFIISYILPTYENDYYLNDYGYDLLISRLEIEPLENTRPEAGFLEQAGYLMEVPENWEDSGRSLVLYAHGYRPPETYGYKLGLTVPSMRSHLIENGFAWAASTYAQNDYVVDSGVTSTDALLDYFKSQYGDVGDVYIIGHSMGGHIAARLITDPEYKDDYAGALPMCGVVGGGNDLFSYQMDWGMLASYYAGLDSSIPWDDDAAPAQEGEFLDALLGPGRDGNGDLGFIPNISPFSGGPFAGQSADLSEAGKYFRDAVMYSSGGDRPLFENAFSYWAGFMVGNATQWLADPNLGGPSALAGNASTQYDLNGDGVIDETGEEALLNDGIARSEDPTSDFEELMYPVSGKIDRPVLTLHTLGDMYVPFSMEQLWAQRIAEEGNQALFRARAIRGLGHCNFTPQEQNEAFDDLVTWVNEGTAPFGDDILNPEVVRQPGFGCVFTRPLPEEIFIADPSLRLKVRSQATDDPTYVQDCIGEATATVE